MVCGQAGFFSAPPLALRARLALASLSPLFTQKITPVLQVTQNVGGGAGRGRKNKTACPQRRLNLKTPTN